MSNPSDPGFVPRLFPDPAEQDYLLQRALDHRQMAERALESGTRMIHLRFQRLYEERAHRLDMVLPD